MTQNIYDDPEFLAGYLQLPRSIQGLDGAPEWPNIMELLPDLVGARVVDLGCGLGWFCRWASDHGAASVLGVDVSQRMLERAARATTGDVVGYRCEDLEVLELPADSFELAYSSLALHYVADLGRLTDVTRRALVDGGAFVFSVEHPAFTAPSRPEFVANTDGQRAWALDGYLSEGERTTRWLVDGVVKHHRTIGSYVNQLVVSGFAITKLIEWGPSAEQIAARPEWSLERHRPPFLLISAAAV